MAAGTSHLGEQQPQRLARAAGGQVPARVEDRAGGHVHDAAGRAEPVQRAVADQAPAEAAEVGEDLVQVLPGQERLEQPDRRELHVVAAADGEREPVPGQRRISRVGPDHHVGGRIVGRRVHRVGPGQRPRGGEPDVEGVEASYLRHSALASPPVWSPSSRAAPVIEVMGDVLDILPA
jgi:hypothetical protein